MSLILLEEMISLPGEIVCHYWNRHANEITALIEVENPEDSNFGHLVRIAGDDTGQRQQLKLPEPCWFYAGEKMIISDDGEQVVFFRSDRVVVVSWATGKTLAVLKKEDISEDIKFDGGDFWDSSSLWIRLVNYNDIYLLVWNWKSGTWSWTSLNMELKVKHFEDGSEFECFRLHMHPSGKFFLGVADFDHGGYCHKVVYLPPPQNGQMQYIHRQELEQALGSEHSHSFSIGGDKVAGVHVLNSNSETNYRGPSYEVRVYALDDFSTALKTYSLRNTGDYILDTQLLANDDFIVLEHESAFSVVDFNSGKVVFRSAHGDRYIELGPGRARFCTRKGNELFVYKTDPALVPASNPDPVAVADEYIRQYGNNLQLTLAPEINCYPDFELVPHLRVHYEFYSATFDIRSKKQVYGELLPPEASKAAEEWFINERASHLAKWEELMRQKVKYTVETSQGPVEFYAISDEQAANSSFIKVVYNNKTRDVYFSGKPKFDHLPGEVAQVATAWMKANYDMLTERWKDKPFYFGMRQSFFQEPKPEPVKPPSFKKPEAEPWETSRNRSLWERIVNFFN